MVYNRIPVAFGAVRRITGPTISYQYDVKQILVISGIELPEYYVVDFCNEGDSTVIPMTGTSDGVEIPDSLLQTGKPVKAYIVLSSGQGDVQTRYEVKLPVNTRPMRDDVHPTDPQQQQIDALVDALNDGVGRAEDAADRAEEAVEAFTHPTASAETLAPDAPATAAYNDGHFTFGVPKGDKGDKLTYADLTEADKLDLIQGPIANAQADAEQAVEDKGEEVIASIPPDYSDLSDDVDNLSLQFQNNSYDILLPLSKTSSSHNGIYYDWVGQSCRVHGTSTNVSRANIFNSANSFPEGMIPGGTYQVRFSSSNVLFQFWYYYNGTLSDASQIVSMDKDSTVTIPSSASGLIIRLYVAKANVTIDETVTPKLLTAKTNAELGEISGFNVGLLVEAGTDLDTITDSGTYIVGIGTYTHNPFPGFASVLTVFKGNDNTVLQNAIKVATGESLFRISLSGSFPSDWVDVGMDRITTVPNNTDLDTIRTQGIYFLTSGYTYTHSPYSSTYGGILLVFKWSGNSILQIAAKAYTGELYVRSSFIGNFPATWGTNGITNNYNNTYTSEHYDNTYNITCSPVITASTNNYLASTNDTTDRTGDIQTMLNTTGVCHLGAGDFYVTGITIPTFGLLLGCGSDSRIILNSSVTTGYAVKLGNYTCVKDVRIVGATTNYSPTGTIGTRHGILFEATASATPPTRQWRATIDNCNISDFNGGAITCNDSGQDPGNSVVCTNVFAFRCEVGIYIKFLSEFHRFTNVMAQACYYGCICNGGNNNFANCDFSLNTTALLIDNSTGQSRNNSHGTFAACSFHHSNNTYSGGSIVSVGTAIKILGADKGEVFIGCQIGYGNIEIDNSVGIRFIGANLMRMTALNVTNSTLVVFDDCTIYDANSSPLTQSGNVSLKFSGCYLRNGTIYNPTGGDIPQDYDDLVNDVVQLQTDVDGLETTTSNLSNAISAKAPVIINTASGDIVTFADGADGMPIKHLVAIIEAVQEGSGDPSPSNVRPITGWAGLTGQVCGKNLSKANTIEGVGWAASNSDLLASFNNLKNGTYVIRIKATVKTVTGTTTIGWICGGIAISPAGNVYFQLSFDGEQPTVGMVKTITKTITINDSNRGSFTAVYVYGCGNNQQGALGSSDLTEIQIEIGTASSDFEPYQGDTISVSWQSEAGTVYGGTLDVVTGELTVEKILHVVSANDATSLYQSGANANRVGIQLPDSKLSPTTADRLKIISNIAKANTDILTASTQKVGDCLLYSGGSDTYSAAIFGVPTTAATASDAKAWLVEQGCAFVYELATSQTYQLDPVTVNTLLGNNTVYVDCGSVSVDYPADTGIVVAEQSNAISEKQDATSYVTLSGTIVTQTGADNTMYLCGELAELTFTAPATGITAIRFTSGTTPTVATFTGVTWLNGFDPSAIEASKTYEINILYGVGVAAWT